MSGPIAWTFNIGDVGREGREVQFTATPAQCRALADALDIAACRSLTVTAHLTPLSRGRCRAEGKLAAAVTQSCVVTLEPVDAEILRAFAIEFWPEADVASQSSASFDALGGEDPEPLDGGTIDLGRVAYELFGASLDLYPRKPGAELTWSDPRPANAPEAGSDSPFAVLGKLKPKP